MMSIPACSCMPMTKRTASSMRRCQPASCWPVREPARSRSLTYCGRGMLPTTVVGKSGREAVMAGLLMVRTQSRGGQKEKSKEKHAATPFRVSVSKVGGIFVHNMERTRFPEKSPTRVREAVMQDKRSNDQDVTDHQLAAELAQLIEDELLDMVRTLDDATPATLFGQTEFKIRDLALQIAAKAYQ